MEIDHYSATHTADQHLLNISEQRGYLSETICQIFLFLYSGYLCGSKVQLDWNVAVWGLQKAESIEHTLRVNVVAECWIIPMWDYHMGQRWIGSPLAFQYFGIWKMLLFLPYCNCDAPEQQITHKHKYYYANLRCSMD